MYSGYIDIGNVTTIRIGSLPAGYIYFALTAYDASGNESGYSNEVRKTVLADSDGVSDDEDDSGFIGDNPCTGGNTVNCDDNCPNTYNPDQADLDGDGIGDTPHILGAQNVDNYPLMQPFTKIQIPGDQVKVNSPEQIF